MTEPTLDDAVEQLAEIIDVAYKQYAYPLASVRGNIRAALTLATQRAEAAEAVKFAYKILPISHGYVNESGVLAADTVRTIGETGYTHGMALSAIVALMWSHEILRAERDALRKALEEALVVDWAKVERAESAYDDAVMRSAYDDAVMGSAFASLSAAYAIRAALTAALAPECVVSDVDVCDSCGKHRGTCYDLTPAREAVIAAALAWRDKYEIGGAWSTNHALLNAIAALHAQQEAK